MFEMPEVEIGQIVLWYHGGQRSSPPAAAMVLAVYKERIDLQIFAVPGVHAYIPGPGKRGVRHMADPATRANEKSEDGCWEHTTWTKKIQAMLEATAELAA